MHTSSSTSYSVGFRSSLPSVPSPPPYSSPYSGHSRYSEYSNSKYGDISRYPTPVVYSRLTRGSSVQDLSPSTPLTYSKLYRHGSLDRDPVQTKRSSQFDRLYHDQSSRGHKEEKKRRPINCNKVFPGVIIGNGETVCDISYLKRAGVTHVLNTAEQHVRVNPAKYALHNIKYCGFHVDDLPHCDISRYFPRAVDFIHSAVSGGGVVAVNCYMGLSRSASCVLAYLISKEGMSLDKALDLVRKSRAIRPNEGFLQQLKMHERLSRFR